MLFTILALLVIASLTNAASPAQATYCSEDNLLRAFQHTPTPASKFCLTDTGYPTFLAIKSYPTTRLSSACSCFSRFPTEGIAAPTCTPATAYALSAMGDGGGDGGVTTINIVITVGREVCAYPYTSGFVITNICGTFNGQPVSYSLADVGGDAFSYSDCLKPQESLTLQSHFRDAAGQLTYLVGQGSSYLIEFGNLYDYYDVPLVDVSCTAGAQCPK